jgi:type II secretory pathway pseudopilin PulG
MKNLKIKRLGIGLLELMLALAIIGTLLIIAVRFYASSSQAQKIADANDQINMIQQACNRWILSNTDFTGIANSFDELVNRNYLPVKYKTSNNPKNPWGSIIAIQKNNGLSLEIYLKNIPYTAANAIKEQNESVVCDKSTDFSISAPVNGYSALTITIHTSC